MTSRIATSYDIVKNYVSKKYGTIRSFLFGDTTLQSNLDILVNWIYNHTLLPDKDKELILFRYTNLMTKVSKKYKSYSNHYTFAHLFTSISSLIVTSLISINNMNNSELSQSAMLWWMSWGLSLSISLVNLLSSFFKWERKYMLLFKIYTRLEQEIWMFIELIGPYSQSPIEPNSHQQQLPNFLIRLEGFYKRLNENLVSIEDNESKNGQVPSNGAHSYTPSADTLSSSGFNQQLKTRLVQQLPYRPDIPVVIDRSSSSTEEMNMSLYSTSPSHNSHVIPVMSTETIQLRPRQPRNELPMEQENITVQSQQQSTNEYSTDVSSSGLDTIVTTNSTGIGLQATVTENEINVSQESDSTEVILTENASSG